MKADKVLAALDRAERAAYEDRAARPDGGRGTKAPAGEETEEKSASLS